MMSNNKILTVSYGTFSCTLEGFDDSFGTMKAIAEYFRDLAADDRYFGAEPPQPDAEMLARIAEREISRRVEARERDGKIVLSAAQAGAAVAAVAAPVEAPASEADPERAEDPVDTERLVADIAGDADDTPVEPMAEQAPVAQDMETEAETVAAREDEAQAEAEAPVAQDADAVAAADDDIDTDVSVDEAETAAAAETPDADDAEDADAFFAASPTLDDAYEDDADDNAPMVAEAEDLEEEMAEAAAEQGPDSIAAKLQRIRAVVSQSQEDAAADEMFEDEHAQEFGASGAVEAAADFDADEDVMAHAPEDLDTAPAADAQEDEDTDDVAEILSRFDADLAEDSAAQADPVAADSTDDDIGLDSLAAMLDSDDDTDENDENLFDADAPLAAAETDDADGMADDDADEEAGTAPRRARIIKVKRADIDAAISRGQLEEDDSDDDLPPSSLSDEDEAELMAELAEVEAELPTAMDEVADEAEDDEMHAEAQRVDDADVNRLMAEADHQMEEPEGSRRRSAFAHLKAAVIAKKADEGIGKDTVEDEGAFRSDLASVVVPRRPAARGERAERPDTARPAPLKLVAEQRVDLDDAAPAGPVRPRRVAARDDVAEVEAGDGSFADYAAEMGAHSLPDLLEAAASYLSFVEGRDQFSRPQLMTKVRQVEKEEFSREDGMRSLGQLLRAGKIEKRKGGRFVVTDDIGYRPEHRAAG